MMDSQHLSEAILEACQIWALFQSVLHTIRLEFPIKIDHISEIWAINDHKSKNVYCMKANFIRDQPKIDHIAEKTL